MLPRPYAKKRRKQLIFLYRNALLLRGRPLPLRSNRRSVQRRHGAVPLTRMISSPVLTCWSYLCCCSGVYNLPMPPTKPCSCVRARRPCHGAAGVFGTHYSIAWAAHERCWCMASAGSAEKQFDWRESGERQQEEAFIQKQHFSGISPLFIHVFCRSILKMLSTTYR